MNGGAGRWFGRYLTLVVSVFVASCATTSKPWPGMDNAGWRGAMGSFRPTT